MPGATGSRDPRLQQRVAIVTGAQQGIGAAIVAAFAAEGAHVVVNYLDDRDAAQRLAAQVAPHGVRTELVPGSVTDPLTVAALMAAAERLGGPHVLVNNAGVFPRSPLLEISESDWDQVLDVNLKGAFRCLQAAAARMIAAATTGASIINIASVVAFAGILEGSHYAASKAGLLGLTRAAALELAPHGIRVNAIAPGVTDTAQPRLEMTDEELVAFGRSLPLGRLTRVEEVADMAVFLASDEARQVTGQTLHVNGGQYLS